LYAYSQRLPASFATNSLTQAVAAKLAAGKPFLDLTVSNPSAVFDYPHADIAAALSRPFDFSYRPEPLGASTARAAVSQLYRERHLAIPPERIALTASTSEAYALLFKLFCNPGDEILIPTPSYPLFDYLASLESVRTVPYRLSYDGAWFLDLAHLRAQISPRARAIVLVNPNNPTGSFLKNTEREQLFQLAAGHRLPLISDEVFMHYGFGSDPARVETLASFPEILSFSLNGLSKAAAMPQMKLAWILLNGPTAEVQAARERLELLLDTYLSVNTPVQLALASFLQIGSRLRHLVRERTRHNLRQCSQILGDSPVHPLHTEGGWSVTLRFPQTRSEEEWVSTLLEHYDTLLQPGFFFDMHAGAMAVASLITPPDAFAEGMRRIVSLAFA
jgi:alanine-synthesizing transaminase